MAHGVLLKSSVMMDCELAKAMSCSTVDTLVPEHCI